MTAAPQKTRPSQRFRFASLDGARSGWPDRARLGGRERTCLPHLRTRAEIYPEGLSEAVGAGGRPVPPGARCAQRLIRAGWPPDTIGLAANSMRWVLFDLNGTLLDPGVIAEPLGGGDEDRRLVSEAFQAALLLTMATTLSGGPYRPLPEYLRATLERALRARDRDTRALDAAMERAGRMDPFPEAEAALTLLGHAGLRLGVLTNSTSQAAEAALTNAGLRDRFEVVIGSDEAQTFKPHPRVYEHAIARLECEPAEVFLVAAHAWDVMGAMRAGLRGAWIARGERWLVPVVPEPDVKGADLEDLARQLVNHSRR